ncbi:MAG TPA: VF530 family protein [Gammaproteobacteria bacterium]
MTGPAHRDPLHGVTLEMMLKRLVEQYGWEQLGRRIRIKCFTSDPSIGSSLTFLRRTPWARKKVEALYLRGAAAVQGVRQAGDPWRR